MNITIYSTTHCGVCHALMQWLDSKGVSYTKKIVDEDESAMSDFMEVNEGMIGTPFSVIEKDGEVYKIQGYDQPKFNELIA